MAQRSCTRSTPSATACVSNRRFRNEQDSLPELKRATATFQTLPGADFHPDRLRRQAAVATGVGDSSRANERPVQRLKADMACASQQRALQRPARQGKRQLEINLKTGLTTATLQKLKTNALDLGLCALPIAKPAFEAVPLFKDDLVAILPTNLGPIPKKVTPSFMSRYLLILGNEEPALRRTVTEWLALAGPPPKPVMEFDNVETIK